MARLESICHVIVDGDWIESKDQSECGIRLIQTGNIGIGEYLDKCSRAKYISVETFERLKCTEVFSGDILISRLPDPIGRACTVPQYIGKAITAVDCTIVRLNNSLCDANYFINYTQSAKYTNELSKFFAGTTRTRISRKNLEKIEVPLLPLDEQRKIAAVLDKVSDLITKRCQQLDKLDEMVKSRFVLMFGDPVENPMRWEKIALGKRCDIVTGNTPSRAEPENYGNFIEWIKSDNINTPAVFLTEAQEYLSETGFHKCRFVEAGSLLMTCIAGSINCIGNVAVTDRRVAFNQQINAIVPKQDNVLYLYWLMLLSKPAIHSTINMALKGILSKGQLSEMTYPFPPIELQNQFSAFVEQTEKAKSTISRSLDKMETIKKALMQEYFG